MNSIFKFLSALFTAILIMLAFRALVFTIYTVPDASLEPRLRTGDRVVVNRWSYGLRTGGNGYFHYSRLFASPVQRGDLIAFNIPQDSTGNIASLPVAIGQVKAIPGDTITIDSLQYVIPQGCRICQCSQHDQLLVGNGNDALQVLVPETHVIGKVILVAFNQRGIIFDKKRWMLIP